MSDSKILQQVLLVDDDPLIAEALAMALEQRGRRTIVCSDPDAAEIYLASAEVTHVVSDVQFSGEFGFEGLQFLSTLRANRPDRPVILISGAASDRLAKNALERGATAVLRKPFEIEALEEFLRIDRVDGDAAPYEIVRIPSMEEILASGALTIAYQPIVRIGGPAVTTFGYEALTRVPGRWHAGGVPALFDYAERRSRLIELNIAAIGQALEEARSIPEHIALFINVDPLVFDREQLFRSITAASSRSGVAISRIVLEITERSAFPATDAARAMIERLRDAGVRFAFDDQGSGHSHLLSTELIRPSFIKLSASVGSGFETNQLRSRIVEHISALASGLNCQLILEGVETAETAAAAVDAGLPLAQGYYFGYPRAASHLGE